MHQLVASYKKSRNLHHAYFLTGAPEEVLLKLKNFIEIELGIKTSGNPDYWYGKFDTFNIDNAKVVAGAQERKDFSDGKKIFVIQTNFITIEAQNSLLKVFEEPTAGTHFFIISPQEILLPTLRSRMHVVQNVSPESSSKTKAVESILNLELSERLARVKEITDAINDEDKTKQDAITFLNIIESELHSKGTEKSAKSLEVCEKARASLYDRGAPIKMILENVMLSV